MVHAGSWPPGLPRQAEVAQWVPGRLRPRIFLTFRHYKGGRSSAKRTGRLYPSRNPWYSLSEAESTSGDMFLSGVPRKKSPVTPPEIDPGTVRLVAQRLNHYATPGPILASFRINFQASLSLAVFLQPLLHTFSSDHFQYRQIISFMAFQRTLFHSGTFLNT